MQHIEMNLNQKLMNRRSPRHPIPAVRVLLLSLALRRAQVLHLFRHLPHQVRQQQKILQPTIQAQQAVLQQQQRHQARRQKEVRRVLIRADRQRLLQWQVIQRARFIQVRQQRLVHQERVVQQRKKARGQRRRVRAAKVRGLA